MESELRGALFLYIYPLSLNQVFLQGCMAIPLMES
jgi:hypothetical protein